MRFSNVQISKDKALHWPRNVDPMIVAVRVGNQRIFSETCGEHKADSAVEENPFCDKKQRYSWLKKLVENKHVSVDFMWWVVVHCCLFHSKCRVR